MAKHRVQGFDDGGTTVNSRVVERTVGRRLAGVAGVRKTKVRVVRGEVLISVVADRETSIEEVRDAIHDRLDVGFWIDTGMADLDYAVDIERSNHD